MPLSISFARPATNFEAQDRWNGRFAACGGGSGFLRRKGEKTSEIAQLDHTSPESENCSGGRAVSERRSVQRSERIFLTVGAGAFGITQKERLTSLRHRRAPSEQSHSQDIMAALTNLFLSKVDARESRTRPPRGARALVAVLHRFSSA